MAIKKKTILTDNLPQSPLTTPVLTNNISIPFALGYPANVTVPLVIQPATFARPTQAKGFDLTTTQLKIPNPIYLNDLNGIFNLYSGALNDLCSGTPIQFDPSYIINRQSYNNQNPAPNPPIPVGYPLDAILFSYPNNAWFRAVVANPDNSINSTSPTTNWKQITNIPTKQILKFNAVGTGSTQYLVPPTGATGFFLTATAFGGNGGAGGQSSQGNPAGGGGGGAGAGVNNIYFDLPTTPQQYRVQYIAGTTLTLTITTPNGDLTLYNGKNGFSASDSGAGGNNGFGTGIGIRVLIQILGTGITGQISGGAGGVSSLSNGQEVRAAGAITNPDISGANGYLGAGGGGGAGLSVGFGIGGNAIVIAEWVFP